MECLPSDATGNDSADNSDNNNFGPPVVIKDAWAYSKEDLKDDTRDKVGFLQTISKELLKHTSDVVYPELLGGGRVSLEYSDTGAAADDTTASTLGDLYNSGSAYGKVPISFRAHKRLVMSPVGEPLKTAKSFDELMAVLADAMLCHDAVWKHCGILHRDIFDNNILVVRQGEWVRGLLIDFDNAITTREQSATRPGRTGTFPFMSIKNLENEGVPRTALDDWESLLYVLCFYATIGLEGIGRREKPDRERLPIKKWNMGYAGDVSMAKRQHLSSSATFDKEVTRHFYSAGVDERAVTRLKDFARELYSALFRNPRCDSSCYGTGSDYKMVDGEEVFVDSFVERAKAKNVKVIIEDLVAIVSQYQNNTE
ncbi:hypothetical protein IWW48_003446 [Coemansia sp. RSA 1200]|nr:hypothetical protein IWW48_003446 [Coemansia sp. RSA 1200]